MKTAPRVVRFYKCVHLGGTRRLGTGRRRGTPEAESVSLRRGCSLSLRPGGRALPARGVGEAGRPPPAQPPHGRRGLALVIGSAEHRAHLRSRVPTRAPQTRTRPWGRGTHT